MRTRFSSLVAARICGSTIASGDVSARALGCARSFKQLRRAAILAVLPLTVAMPAWSDGPNTSSPNTGPPPPTFTQVTTDAQLPDTTTTVQPNTCQQQYTDAINQLWLNQITDRTSAGNKDTTATTDQIAGLVAEAAAIPLIFPLDDIAQVTAIGLQATALDKQKDAIDKAKSANTNDDMQRQLEFGIASLPNCNAEFTGTVTVEAGGVNVTGVSVFNDSVGIDGDLNVNANVTASQVHAMQGISADGGNIWLGDPNGTTYSNGITLGGGALSGAGTIGKPQASTGDADAIAIGNGSNAAGAGSTALGTGANGQRRGRYRAW